MINIEDFADKVEQLLNLLSKYKMFSMEYGYSALITDEEGVNIYGLENLRIFLNVYKTFGSYVCTTDKLFTLLNTYQNICEIYAANKNKFKKFETVIPDYPIVTVDSEWTHTNGNIYKVICIANEKTENEIKYPVTVVYQGENGNIWSRPLNDWHRSMTLKVNKND